MKEYEYIVKIIRPGRTYENDNYPFNKLAYLQFWDDVPVKISSFEISCLKGNFRVNIIWEPIIEYIKKTIEPRRHETCVIKKFLETGEIPEPEELNLKILVLDIKEKSDEKNIYQHLFNYVRNILYDLFIIFNLSFPGSLNMYNACIGRNNTDLEYLRLNGITFEDALVECTLNNWPKVDLIPIEKTWNWYKNLKINFRQVAMNRIERALFATLHACKNSATNPINLIWLSHALEALYDTPQNSIVNTLKQRIFLLLGEPVEGRTKISKKINNFYNLRSRFVHGDFETFHPSFNDILDNKIITISDDVISTFDFAYSIILSTFQKLIKNNWKNAMFSESFRGEK